METNNINTNGANENGVQGINKENTVKENGKENEVNKVDYETLLKGVNIDDLLKQSAVASKVQAMADKRVTEAINTAKKKWEAEAIAKAEAEKDEATKLANMSAAEKEKYQFEKEKAEFLKEKAEYEHNALIVETSKQLLSLGLPDIADYVTGKDAETTKENIDKISAVLNDWKKLQVIDKMRGTAPKELNTNTKKITTKEEFDKMSTEDVIKALHDGTIDVSKLI